MRTQKWGPNYGLWGKAIPVLFSTSVLLISAFLSSQDPRVQSLTALFPGMGSQTYFFYLAQCCMINSQNSSPEKVL